MRHALLARRLIAACGGLMEAERSGARLKHSHLARFCDPQSGYYMPADVIADLEAYCGEPVYSRALVEARPARNAVEDLVTEAAETTEAAAALQRLVREAAKDGVLTPTERRAIDRGMLDLEEQLRELRTAAAEDATAEVAP